MSEQDKKNIATVLSSILISNMRKMTIRELNTDFQKTEGYRIPYQKFGYGTLEQFLRTLNDKMMVYGSGMHAEVRPIISSKAAHIEHLISKQKAPKIKKPTRSARNSYSQEVNRRHNYTYTRPPIYNDSPQISPTNQYTRPITLNTTPASPGTSSTGAVPKPVPNNNNSECNVEDIYFSDDEDVRNTRVPHFIQDKLWRLIVKHPDGILCSNLLELYRKQYEETLSYSDYGYRSIAQMCVDLRGIFNIVQLDKSEIKLFDKRKPIPQDTLNIAKKLQLMKIKASIETPTENAVPQADLEEMMSEIYSEKAPPDVLCFGDRLEQQWIDPGTNEQDYLDVNVGEVYDPSKFWLNLKPYAWKLNNLMDTMQMYYAIHKQELLVPYFALKKDLYVACTYSDEYHRARIVDASQKNDSMIKVYFVDYGTVGMVNIQGVCYLHNKFAELPEQAIRARLAGIYPATENEQWSRAASSRLLSFVLQKDLLAQLIRINEEQKILDVVLADTTEDDEDFFINDALVSMGYAIFTFQERKPAENTEIVPIVRYIHLYPTHYELESGLVPNAVQMINMHQAGLVIEQIYPHYFKDAKTGQPISKKHMIVKEDLPVDYDIERPYYEEDNNDDLCYDEGEEATAANENDARHEGEASTSKENFVASPLGSVRNHWEDIIAEVELNTATVIDDSNDISLQSPKQVVEGSAKTEQISNSNSNAIIDVINENIRNTIKEYIKQECSQTLANNFVSQTNGEAEITTTTNNNDTNIETNTKVLQTNNYTQINVSPKKIKLQKTKDKINANNQTPLRPPPGLNSVTAHDNTTSYSYSYNNSPKSNANNYINAQTYINYPVPYNPTALHMPMAYNYNYPPYQCNTYNNILRSIQYLVSCGARLTPEQQRYLQSFNWGGANYHLHYNNYGVQTELSCNDMPSSAFPEACASAQNCHNANSPNFHQESPKMDNTIRKELSNKSVLNPIAVSFTPDRAVTSTPKCIDQSTQVDTGCENRTVLPDIKTKCSELSEKHKITSTEVIIADKLTAAQRESPNDLLTDNSSEIATNESPFDNNEQSEKQSVNSLNALIDEHMKQEDIKENIIFSDNNVQEVENVYEECDSNSVDNYSYGIKLIIPISIGKLNMHIVCLENEYYFLLSELLKKIFPKSLTVLRIRKLFVASPCTISIVDIRLKRNPELKKELLMYDLIGEDELTVDAVPIKYFEELIKIIPMPENDDYIVANLLEEISCFLSEHNLESVC